MAYSSSRSSSSTGSDTKINVAFYQVALESVEERLEVYRKTETIFEKNIKSLNIDVKLRDKVLVQHRQRFESVEKERDEFKLKLDNFQNSSKNLNNLLDSQVCANNKTGLGYDNQGSDKNKPVDEKVSQNDEENKSSEGYHASATNVPAVVSKVEDSKEKPMSVRRENSPPINEELLLDGKKKTIFSTAAKIEFVRPKQPEKPVRKPVKQVNTARPKAVVNAVRTNRVNVVKASACWVLRPIKPNSASITLKRYDYGNPETELEDSVRLNSPEDKKFSLRDQASSWLERLPTGSITTWEDLTNRFLAQSFPSGRTAKLQNDILMFQQHHDESLSEAWTHFKDLLQKVPHHGIDLWLQIQIIYDHVSFHLKCEIDRAAGGKLYDRNAKESWEIIENLTLYDHESWNDSNDFGCEVDSRTINEPVGSAVKDISREKVRELVEAPRSQPIEFYLKHRINKELIEGLVGNPRFNDSLLAIQLGKMGCETYHSLPVEPMRKAILKKMISKKEDMEEREEDEINPTTPISIVSKRILEWEERIKFHLGKEMEFDQWRSKVFNKELQAPAKEEFGLEEEGGVTLYLMRRSFGVLRSFIRWLLDDDLTSTFKNIGDNVHLKCRGNQP
ncbi:zinc finger, CCHC-type containing protein [Tanacetum coccineum]|uniref:Zinc finger, CCHC-type containing protein n=1 Tax=Tanacetum coccineum TaxID=301880 RepID=A0ABQ5A847_9ASTR